MKIRAIKVIKRNKKVQTENSQVVVIPLKSEGAAREKVVNTLNGWIAEWRENDRAERVDSNNKLLEWKTT
jgi:hypothetical protein